MKNKWLLLSLCAGYSFALCAQNPENDPVLMKVNGKSIKKSEFEYIYKKNNQQQTDSKSLDEYLELFKNYKLKVAEAEACGLDTTRSFRTELAGYRAQLVQPYLVDREMDDRLAKEAYDRLKENVEVSHILFRVNPGMTDTEKDKVYQKAKSVLERIRKGEDFGKLAKEYSEDPSVKRNGGYLGYRRIYDSISF
ncbi:MAG: peptidylprolyl isomerase [Coprobacter fastidiosus]